MNSSGEAGPKSGQPRAYLESPGHREHLHPCQQVWMYLGGSGRISMDVSMPRNLQNVGRARATKGTRNTMNFDARMAIESKNGGPRAPKWVESLRLVPNCSSHPFLARTDTNQWRNGPNMDLLFGHSVGNVTTPQWVSFKISKYISK